MSNTKILDLIPENLKPLFIEEVKALLAEEEKKKNQGQDPNSKEIEDDIKSWANTYNQKQDQK